MAYKKSKSNTCLIFLAGRVLYEYIMLIWRMLKVIETEIRKMQDFRG